MDNEKFTIPFEKIKEAINYMNYGSPERIMFELLTITGCRLTELNKMKFSGIAGSILYWHLGKNQKTTRKENIPEYLLEEIVYMRKNYKCSDNLFPISTRTFCRYFNRDIRPKLSPEWNRKIMNFERKIIVNEYLYRLKLLRKNYQTLLFKKYLDKFNGHYDIALQFTSRHMKHSSTRMTAFHYLQGLDEIKRFEGLMPEEILNQQGNQKRLIEFFN